MAKKSSTSTQHETILVDLEFPGLKRQLERLEEGHQTEILDAMDNAQKKLEKMTWQQLYDSSSKTSGNKSGFNYEPISGQATKSGKQISSIRLNQKIRARVCREGRFMRFISIHPDHDSAYKKKGGEEI